MTQFFRNNLHYFISVLLALLLLICFKSQVYSGECLGSCDGAIKQLEKVINDESSIYMPQVLYSFDFMCNKYFWHCTANYRYSSEELEKIGRNKLNCHKKFNELFPALVDKLIDYFNQEERETNRIHIIAPLIYWFQNINSIAYPDYQQLSVLECLHIDNIYNNQEFKSNYHRFSTYFYEKVNNIDLNNYDSNSIINYIGSVNEYSAIKSKFDLCEKINKIEFKRIFKNELEDFFLSISEDVDYLHLPQRNPNIRRALKKICECKNEFIENEINRVFEKLAKDNKVREKYNLIFYFALNDWYNADKYFLDFYDADQIRDIIIRRGKSKLPELNSNVSGILTNFIHRNINTIVIPYDILDANVEFIYTFGIYKKYKDILKNDPHNIVLETNISNLEKLFNNRFVISPLKKLGLKDVQNKSLKELEFMRNSIFARYNYKFNNQKYFRYFSKKGWYYCYDYKKNLSEIIHETDKYNINFIKSHENKILNK